MSEENITATHAESDIDYASRPFGYLDPDRETAMICEQDPVLREKISNELKKLGIEVVEPATFREASKFMRFHVFDVIFINEYFDTGIGETNNLLSHLEGLSMTIRRQMFVVLISSNYATLDNMQTYNKSVNLILNKADIDELEVIMKRAMTEHNDFYHVYKENIRKFGKI